MDSPIIIDCIQTDEIIPCEQVVPKSIKNFKIVKMLDSGMYGVVYLAKANGGSVIIKVFKSNRKEEIEHEICFQHIAAQNKIAPPILDYWLCGKSSERAGDFPERALIVMGYGGNYVLEEYIRDISQKAITDEDSLKKSLQVYKAMLNLYYLTLKLNMESKIFHQDLHLKNVLLTLNKYGIITDMKIIDYGKSEGWEDFNESINERICNRDAPNKYDGIAHMYKMLFADLVAPLEFYDEKFILKKTNYPVNPVIKWVYEDWIKYQKDPLCLLQYKSWYVNDVKDHMDDLAGNVKFDMEDRLDKFKEESGIDIDNDSLIDISTELIEL